MAQENIVAADDGVAGEAGHGITFREALRTWIKVGMLSFGGPAGQIAVMHRILVEEKRWIGETRFLHALNYCMLLPGPEAMQLATYVGWLFHKTRGGLVAGTLFVLPGFVSILGLSLIYAGLGRLAIVQALFFGLKAAVLAIVVEAVLRIGRRALKNQVMVGLSAAAFIGIFFFDVEFPLIVLAAALIGLLGGRIRPDWFPVPAHKAEEGAVDALLDHAPDHARPSLRRAVTVSATWLTLWFAPVLVLGFLLGWNNIFTTEAVFFSKMAVVTFGGAYAVLAYVAQEAVNHFGWLQPGQMLDGLALAETTPGPLIMVTQFVGFLGAFHTPGTLNPLLAGSLASLVVVWTTFVPCFYWIFLGAPYIEALRGNRALGTALSAITASVVGVILNLAVWFALHAIFGQLGIVHAYGARIYVPVMSSLDFTALGLAVVAILALFRFKLGAIWTLALCGGLGIALRLALG